MPRIDPLNEDLTFWAEAQICENPGIWTAKLCRLLNGLPECVESIMHCGRCQSYANQRKRERAAQWAEIPALPGIEPPYQLHPSCKAMPFKKLQYLLKRYENRGCGNIVSRREVIPDERNHRGWDYAWRWYPR